MKVNELKRLRESSSSLNDIINQTKHSPSVLLASKAKTLGVQKKGSCRDIKANLDKLIGDDGEKQDVIDELDRINSDELFYKKKLKTEMIRSQYFSILQMKYREGQFSPDAHLLSKTPPVVNTYVKFSDERMLAFDIYRGFLDERVANIYRQLSIKIQVGDYDADEFKKNTTINGEMKEKPPHERFGMWFERNISFFKVKQKGRMTTAFGALCNRHYLSTFYQSNRHNLVGGWSASDKSVAARQLLTQAYDFIQFIRWVKSTGQMLPRGADIAPMIYKNKAGEPCAKLVILDIDHASFGPQFVYSAPCWRSIWDDPGFKKAGGRGADFRAYVHKTKDIDKYNKLADAIIASVINVVAIMLQNLELYSSKQCRQLSIPWQASLWNKGAESSEADRESIINSRLDVMQRMEHQVVSRRDSHSLRHYLNVSGIFLQPMHQQISKTVIREKKVLLRKKAVAIDELDGAYRKMVKAAAMDIILKSRKNLLDHEITHELSALKSSQAKRKLMPKIRFSVFDSNKLSVVKKYAEQYFDDVSVEFKPSQGG